MNNYKKLKVILLLFVFCFSFLWNVFAYRELMIQDLDWKPIRVMKVVLDWQDFVITSLAGEWWDTLENLVKNVWWDAGINGTFFCPADYSYCNWVTHSTFERVFLWKGVSPSTDTSVRMIFGFDIEWSPFMAQSKLSTYDSGLYMNWNIDRITDFEFGLSNYTVLLYWWENIVRTNEVNFSSNMYSSANRNFICSTKDWKTIYMWIVGGVSIPSLASYVKKNFGCYNALALDAWASEAMVFDWNVLKRSSRRKIMDAFVIVDRDTYIKLTWYTPAANDPYMPQDYYSLTIEDAELADDIYDTLKKVLEIEWSSFIATEKKLVRTALSTPWISIRDKAILQRLIVKLFTIDTL